MSQIKSSSQVVDEKLGISRRSLTDVYEFFCGTLIVTYEHKAHFTTLSHEGLVYLFKMYGAS